MFRRIHDKVVNPSGRQAQPANTMLILRFWHRSASILARKCVILSRIGRNLRNIGQFPYGLHQNQLFLTLTGSGLIVAIQADFDHISPIRDFSITLNLTSAADK
jgi:hypothetical protein